MMKKRMKPQDAVRFFLITLAALFISACSTRPVSIGRHGLLDTEQSAARVAKGDSAESKAQDLYAPKEGENFELTGKWRWPLDHVEFNSPFGQRGKKFHQGIDLKAAIHTPVYAASDGVVVYVGSKIRGYGRMVVIKHPDDFYSIYAHHSKNLVKAGKRVKRGDLIAYSGKSGHADGPHLHFEIRHGTQSFDPAYALNENIKVYASSRSVASRKRK